MSKICLVGCGKAKKKEAHQAKNLYTSTYFQKKREFAETCESWWILSAKHCLISPEKEIEHYDTSISDVDSGEWGRKVCEDLENLDLSSVDEVFVLAGQKYIQAIRCCLSRIDAEIRYPFEDTSGIGEQIQWLHDRTNTKKVESL